MDREREVISVHIGQAGIQMGQAMWELLAAEHGIGKDGKCDCRVAIDTKASTFFRQSVKSEYYVPRAIFLDLEANVIDDIRTSQFRTLFHPDCFIHALDDSASNFARAYYTTGTSIAPKYIHQLRRQVEQCDNLQAMMFMHSQGGGTGAGLCAKVVEYITDTLGKISKMEFPIIPSPIFSNSIVEPYNACLSNHFNIAHFDTTTMLGNEAMYEICMRYMNLQCPTFHHINRMVAHIISTLTCNIRFDGVLRADLNQLNTNLVPYPRIHFLINSFGPILSRDRSDHENLSVAAITRMVFCPEYQMAKIMSELGKFMSIGLFYRGDVNPRLVNEAVLNIKNDKEVRFVDWCPTGYKISINSQPSTCVPGGMTYNSPRYVSMIGNNTAASQIFQRIITKFETLYHKRSFVHWYVGEGLEEGEFSESVENIKALVRDYQECGLDTEAEGGVVEDLDEVSAGGGNSGSRQKSPAEQNSNTEPRSKADSVHSQQGIPDANEEVVEPDTADGQQEQEED